MTEFSASKHAFSGQPVGILTLNRTSIICILLEAVMYQSTP